MPVTYKITEKDYVDAMRLHQRATRTATIVYVILIAALALLTVFASEPIRGYAIGGLGGGISAFLLLRLVFLPMMAKRHYRKYKAIQEPMTIDLKDTGIQLVTTNGNSLITWDKLLKWRQDDRYILVYPMPQIFYMIRKDIAQQGFDLDALIAALTTHLGKPT